MPSFLSNRKLEVKGLEKFGKYVGEDPFSSQASGKSENGSSAKDIAKF